MIVPIGHETLVYEVVSWYKLYLYMISSVTCYVCMDPKRKGGSTLHCNKGLKTNFRLDCGVLILQKTIQIDMPRNKNLLP